MTSTPETRTRVSFRRAWPLAGPLLMWGLLVVAAPPARAEATGVGASAPARTAPSPARTAWWGPLHLGAPSPGAARSPRALGIAQAASPPPAGARRPATPATGPLRIATGGGPRVKAAGARLGQACQSDAECVAANTICERRRCVRIKRAINILWLFYRSADRRYTEVLGLYHHQKGRRGYHVLAPFYFHFWSRRSDTRVVAPFFVQHRDKVARATHTFVLNFHHLRAPGVTGFNVWPFLFTRSYGKRGFSFTVLPLLHYKRRGPAWSMYFLLFPPWYVSRSPGRTTWAVVPFAAGTVTKSKTFTWVAPLSFYWRKGKRRHYLFFPLYFGHTRPGRTISLLIPLYWYSRDGKRRTQLISPLAIYDHHRARRSWFFWWTAPPVLFARSPRRRVNMVLPFFYHHHLKLQPPWQPRWRRRLGPPPPSPGAERLYVFPLLLSYFQQRPGLARGMVFPLLFYRRSPTRSHTVVFPLFWQFRNERRGTSDTLAGNVLVRRGPGRWSAAVLPLFYVGRSRRGSHQILLPLFWHRVDRVARRRVAQVLTAYWWQDGDSWGHGLIPLYGFSRRYDHRGRVSSRLGIFPLLYHAHDHRRRVLVTPLGGLYHDYRTGRRTTVAGPLFWHRSPSRRTWGLLPFYVSDRDLAQDAHGQYIFPIFWHYRDPQHRKFVAPPLVWHYRSPAGSATVVFPLFWRFHPRFGWKADLLLPVFALLRKPGHRFLLAGPIYSYERPGRRHFGVAPLLFVGWGRKASYGHVFPIVWHYQNHERGTGYSVVGPVWNVRRKDGHASGIFPLLWWGRRGTYRYALVAPLLWYEHDPARRFRKVVALPFFFLRDGSMRVGGLVPLGVAFADPKRRALTVWSGPFLYHQRRDRIHAVLAPLLHVFHRGRNHWALTLLPLAHYRRTPTERHLWTPLFGFGSHTPSGSRYGYAGPVGWSWSPTRDAQVVFPLFWRFANRQARTRTLVIPPLYVGHRSPRGRTDVVPPLFVHHRRGPSRAVVLFPLVWSFSNSERRTRTLVAFPFYYWRTRDAAGGGLAPLVSVKVTSRGERTVSIFPLLHLIHAPRRLRVLTPLFGFGRDRKARSRFTYLGPVYWSRSPHHDTQVVFPLFWRTADRRARTTFLTVFPLYFGHRSRRAALDVVFPLLWLHRTKRSRTLVLLPFYVGHFSRKESRWAATVPIFFYHYDVRARDHRVVVPPLYVRHGPLHTDVALFPLLWHFSSKRRSSTVVFPLVWDFRRGPRRATVVFPVFWRFASKDRVHTVVLNTYYGYHRRKGTWRLLILPLLEVARKRPGDFKIGFFGGLVGYERIGRNRYLKLFFGRIRLKSLPARPAPGGPPLQQATATPAFYPI